MPVVLLITVGLQYLPELVCTRDHIAQAFVVPRLFTLIISLILYDPSSKRMLSAYHRIKES